LKPAGIRQLPAADELQYAGLSRAVLSAYRYAVSPLDREFNAAAGFLIAVKYRDVVKLDKTLRIKPGRS